MFCYRQIEKSGSYNITGLLPWRQYVIQVNAESEEYNLTDFVYRTVITGEEGWF